MPSTGMRNFLVGRFAGAILRRCPGDRETRQAASLRVGALDDKKTGKSASSLFPAYSGGNSVCLWRHLGAQVRRLGFVHAERLLVEIVAGSGKGARAASHADIAE